jgi:hypothetical protein
MNFKNKEKNPPEKVGFLFFLKYGKIVMYKIDCLEKEIKNRR